MTGGPTPSQTVGPFIAMIDAMDHTSHHVAGADDPSAIWVGGTVVDGDGHPIGDAMIELWQADETGRYPSPADPRPAAEGFAGFARCFTDEQGRWAVRTHKPGPVPGPDDTWQAPHLAVGLFARGLLQRLATRLYFADEPGANAADPVLARLSAEQAHTVTAAPTDAGYHLDLRLQGPDATVFFTLR